MTPTKNIVVGEIITEQLGKGWKVHYDSAPLGMRYEFVSVAASRHVYGRRFWCYIQIPTHVWMCLTDVRLGKVSEGLDHLIAIVEDTKARFDDDTDGEIGKVLMEEIQKKVRSISHSSRQKPRAIVLSYKSFDRLVRSMGHGDTMMPAQEGAGTTLRVLGRDMPVEINDSMDDYTFMIPATYSSMIGSHDFTYNMVEDSNGKRHVEGHAPYAPPREFAVDQILAKEKEDHPEDTITPEEKETLDEILEEANAKTTSCPRGRLGRWGRAVRMAWYRIRECKKHRPWGSPSCVRCRYLRRLM